MNQMTRTVKDGVETERGEQKPVDISALKRFKDRPLSWWIAPLCRECPNCSSCGSQELACGEFAAFVNGTDKLKRFGKTATKEWFEYVFGQDADNKKVEMALLKRAKASTPTRVEKAAA